MQCFLVGVSNSNIVLCNKLITIKHDLNENKDRLRLIGIYKYMIYQKLQLEAKVILSKYAYLLGKHTKN